MAAVLFNINFNTKLKLNEKLVFLVHFGPQLLLYVSRFLKFSYLLAHLSNLKIMGCLQIRVFKVKWKNLFSFKFNIVLRSISNELTAISNL